MKHNEDGQLAEKKVADYLTTHGWKIIDTNWKTPKCEIDIIASKDNCAYFVEVKYRSGSAQGQGFDYITASKQKQMAYAAQYWVQANDWQGEYVLSAASVSGVEFEVEFLEEI